MPKWSQGQSGNPNGRPPKSRALTDILARGGSIASIDVDGKKRSGKQIVARALWELLRTGQTELRIDADNTRRLIVGEKGWFEIVKWIWGQVDGPPKLEHDITTGGEKLSRLTQIIEGIPDDSI